MPNTPTDTGIVYDPNDEYPAGPLIGLAMSPELEQALQSFRAGGELGIDLTPGWVAESLNGKTHVTLTGTLVPSQARLAVAFDTTSAQHMTALVDVATHEVLYYIDHATYQQIRIDGDTGGDYGRRVLGIPGTQSQLRQAFADAGLPYPSAS